jgi:hypothetical protein
MKSVSQPHKKPTLIGGTPPPRGFTYKVHSFSNHHLYVLSVLADHFNYADSKVLQKMIQFFIEHNRPLVDEAFTNRGNVTRTTKERQNGQP